jgi:cytochrome c-type biogenesis protein CcmH
MKIKPRILVAGLGLWLVAIGVAHAGIEVRQFKNPANSQRFERLTHELRCLVCQNESIAASNADLAKDLRQEIYDKVEAGQTDKQIIDFMVARYGDYVLYKPPFEPLTVLLWVGPFLMLLTGLAIIVILIRRKGGPRPAVVTSDELDRAREILQEGNENQ